MKSTEIQDVFEEKGIHVFTLNDVVRLSGKKRAYVWLMLNRMVSKNMIHRVERGLFYTKKASPLEIASNVVSPSYVSLMSALSYHGVTTQIPIVIDVVTTKRHRMLEINGTMPRVVFRTLKRDKMFGFYRNKNNISIAELEKAIVDSLYLNRPGLGELSEAIEESINSGKADVTKIRNYAERMGSKAVTKKFNAIIKSLEAYERRAHIRN